jgi:ABC-type glycerol-3-phosphate transport system permease component
MKTFVAIVLGCMGGYALARFRMKGEKAYLMFILVTRMFPAVVFLIPFFIMMRNLGLPDSFTGLIISYTVFSLPFSIWLLRGFFRNIPSELEEAARIDGCTRAKAFTRIILPLSAPGIAATAVFCFYLHGTNSCSQTL